jgi:molybdopterin-guanine dinucleotide biosynthesis protein A
MGRDKALLPWGDTDLLGHAVARLTSVTHDVRILAGAEPRHTERGLPVVVDAAPDLGPLAGLLAALESAQGPALLLGVDLPLIPPKLLVHLATLLREGEADAVVPVTPRGPEPLCAAYAPASLPPVRRRLTRGDLKVTALLTDLRVREVGPDALTAFGPPDDLFLNVNTPEDYEHALALAARHPLDSPDSQG